MRNPFFCAKVLASIVAFSFTASTAMANLWIDEDFEEATVFIQGDGAGVGAVSPANATVDVYDADGTPAVNTTNFITATGALTTSKAFQGSGSYELAAGESIVVADGYDGQTNGDMILFQFAVNVDPIPATAEQIATFTYDRTLGGTNTEIFVNLAADGAGNVEITGGQNAPTPETLTLGSLSSGSDWEFISVAFINGGGGNFTDDRPNVPISAAATGAQFFVSSTTPAGTTSFAGGAQDANGWSIEVDSGTSAVLYVDNLYWDSGEDELVNSAVDPFDSVPGTPSSVIDWPLFR
jgi:hypothetical protein